MSDSLSRLSAALGDRYLLERELGHGGMATVYLARDPKHRRMVALKVLRPELAASLGPARFLHEIEIAAQLQHPHILPLLDSGEADGFLYYVMPYVEGESLRERLDRKGELPVPEAVRILAEVADALAYAHSRDVVHRDMKPDNIMLSGRHPLVMDFGIAKAVNPTPGSQHPTTAGVALGTPAYMAPEQAAADPHLDHRVDIYAFGVIGYELLTGSTPFTGTSAQQILAAHMTQRPEPISSRRSSISPGLATILMQCLEKRPADRPQSADELLGALETIMTPGEGLTPTDTRPVRRSGSAISRRALMTAGAILVIAIAGLLWQGRAVSSRPALARHSQLTFLGNIERQEISPDGQFLAYIERGEPARLLVKDLTGGSVIPIAKLGKWRSTLRWSPDGSSILYSGIDSTGHRASVLFPRLGGTPRRLGGGLPYTVLSPDGSRLAGWTQNSEPPIYVKTLATGAIREINMPEGFGWRDEGDWSPTGRAIALASTAKAGSRWMLWVVNTETGGWHEIVSDSVPLGPPRWAPAGDALYFLRQGSDLLKVHVTPDGAPRGVPELLETGIGFSSFGTTQDGRKLTYVKRQPQSNLWLATRPRGHARFTTVQLTRGTAEKKGSRLSPDGRQVAYVQNERGRGDVFVIPIDGGVPRRLTSSGLAGQSLDPDPNSEVPLAWSPDGQRVAYVAAVQGKNRLRTVALEGGEERTYDRIQVSQELVWAPYERILYQRPGNRNYHWLDLTTGTEEPLVKNDSVGWILYSSPSPDGHTLAVYWNREPKGGVYLISLRDGSQRPIGQLDNIPLGWSLDGAFVYAESQDESGTISRVSVDGGDGVIIARNPFKDAPCTLRERPSALGLLCNVDESISDVWMMENFDPVHRP